MHNKKTGAFISSRTSIKLINCFLLVGLADFLFYGHPAGWTLGLFSLLLLLASAVHNFRRIVAHRLPLIALFTSMVTAAALIEAPNAYTVGLCIFTALAFALLIRHPFINDLRKIVKGVLGSFLIPEWRALLASCINNYKRKTRSRKSSFVRHWLMPCVFLALFVALFSQANPILALWLSSIDWSFIPEYFSPLRILFWFFMAAVCWAVIRPGFRKHKAFIVPSLTTDTSAVTGLLFNERSILIGLILFNILFALQNSMDVAILWSGVALPNGVTYAEYAHQGAYPLIFTAMLAALFVLIALRPGSTTENMPLIRALVYVWVGQNIFLVISSVTRLVGYIEEFSLTYLRIWALIWMGLVGLGLVLIIARIYLQKSNLWLINSNGVLLYAVLILSCFINFGGVVANYNVKHCMEVSGKGANLDTYYLQSLGVDALPALQWYRTNYYHPISVKGVSNWSRCKSDWNIDEQLTSLREELSNSMHDWRQWTYRNYRLNQELKSLPCSGCETCE